jgi:DNA polymerase/3'-5' exonuclease PolX
VSGETKYPAAEMFRLVLEVMSLLTDVCDRLHIAGSLRRCKQQAGDIELVMTPRYAGDLNLLELRCEDLLRCKVVEKRLNKNGHTIAWGKAGESSRYKAVVYKGRAVDLFIVLPDRQWGPTFLIRSGPDRANRVLVTAEGVRTRDYNDLGILPEGMAFNEGAVWSGMMRLDTPEEADVYAALGLPYIQPYARSVGMYQLLGKRRNDHPALCQEIFDIGFGLSVIDEVNKQVWQPYYELNWTVQPTWHSAALPETGEQIRMAL